MRLYLSLCAKRELSPWPGDPGSQQYHLQAHALARAGFRMGVRARVGLPPEGREAGRACGQGRLFLGWAAFGMAGFLEVVAVRCYY